MSKTKFNDNNRRTHAAKVIAQASKKNQAHEDVSEHADHSDSEKNTSALNEDMPDSKVTSNKILEQYRIIREDVLKLREDLSQGYDMLKEWIDKKISVRNILRQNR